MAPLRVKRAASKALLPRHRGAAHAGDLPLPGLAACRNADKSPAASIA
jgi:hypothetical protein